MSASAKQKPTSIAAVADAIHVAGVWLFLGLPAVTLLLCCVGWLGFVLWEYLHNVNRHLYEVVIMTPLISVVSFVAASMSQLIAYAILPLYTLILLRLFGRVSLVPLIAVTPLIGLLSWFGYEHFVPDYRWYTDQDAPYEYGLTLRRFLVGWAFEALVVFLYWWPFRKLNLSSTAVTQADALR